MIGINELSELIKKGGKSLMKSALSVIQRTGGNTANNSFTFSKTIKRWQQATQFKIVFPAESGLH
jgi:hypothetical protein